MNEERIDSNGHDVGGGNTNHKHVRCVIIVGVIGLLVLMNLSVSSQTTIVKTTTISSSVMGRTALAREPLFDDATTKGDPLRSGQNTLPKKERIENSLSKAGEAAVASVVVELSKTNSSLNLNGATDDNGVSSFIENTTVPDSEKIHGGPFDEEDTNTTSSTASPVFETIKAERAPSNHHDSIQNVSLSPVATSTDSLSYQDSNGTIATVKLNGNVSSDPMTEQSTSRRPKFILHIGPGKTATTSLQYDLSFLTEQLQQDNYIYLGKNTVKVRGEPIARGLVKGLVACQKGSPPSCWESSLKTLQQYRQNHSSIILSDEDYSRQRLFARFRLPAFQKFIVAELEQHWDVVIVATYRRYGEWLPSAKMEWDNGNCLRTSSKWPDQGKNSPECKSMREAITAYHRRHMAAGWYLGSDGLVQHLHHFGATNASTVLLNFHHPLKSLTHHFVCDALQAQHTCQHLTNQQRQQATIQSEKNVSSASTIKNVRKDSYGSLFDRLVVDAYQKGLLNRTDHRRRVVVQEIEELGIPKTTLLKKLPTKCPSSETFEGIYNTSHQLARYFGWS